jgi:hypothetical protein
LHAQNTVLKNDTKVPVFVDSVQFTNCWTNNTAIRGCYNSLRKREDYAVIEYFFNISKKGSLLPLPNRDSVFIKGFNKYSWLNITQSETFPFIRNIKVILSVLPQKKSIKMEVEILNEFNPNKHILKYKTVYNKEVHFN